jgi:hypothetical protein
MGNCDPYSDSPEPEVVDKPQLTRVKEPTLLCNHVGTGISFSGKRTNRAVGGML